MFCPKSALLWFDLSERDYFVTAIQGPTPCRVQMIRVPELVFDVPREGLVCAISDHRRYVSFEVTASKGQSSATDERHLTVEKLEGLVRGKTLCGDFKGLAQTFL